MPRFFFRVQLGIMYPDEHGTELPDEHAACAVALQIVSQLVRDAADSLSSGEAFRVFAEDEGGTPVFHIEVTLTGCLPRVDETSSKSIALHSDWTPP